MDKLIEILQQMKTDPVQNYVIAGLESSLLANGRIRLFEASRNQLDAIAPHSHRFDFTCLVLAGEVENETWSPCPANYQEGNLFAETYLHYTGTIGRYKTEVVGHNWYTKTSEHYGPRAVYHMTAEQIHSIKFGKGTKVLFFEGPERFKQSIMLQPVVDGEIIPTGETRPYMFRRKPQKEWL